MPRWIHDAAWARILPSNGAITHCGVHLCGPPRMLAAVLDLRTGTVVVVSARIAQSISLDARGRSPSE